MTSIEKSVPRTVEAGVLSGGEPAMPRRQTSPEEAHALGFSSVAACEQHEEWLRTQAARFAAEKAYQSTPEADARRRKAAEEAGIDPATIPWITPPRAEP